MLAEVDYFLRDERQGMQLFMQDLARGAFTYAPPTLGQHTEAVLRNDLGMVPADIDRLREQQAI